jgi:hypothetical protein
MCACACACVHVRAPANAGAHVHQAAVGRQAAVRGQALQHALHAAARQCAVQALYALPAAQLVLRSGTCTCWFDWLTSDCLAWRSHRRISEVCQQHASVGLRWTSEPGGHTGVVF